MKPQAGLTGFWERVTVPLREAVQDMMPLIELYAKREINGPANHQEFARQTEEKLDRLRAALAQESKTGAAPSPSPLRNPQSDRHSESKGGGDSEI